MNGKFYDFALAPFEILFLKKLRKNIIQKAQGKTLEIGFGTGLNFPYYAKNIQYCGIEIDDSMKSVAEKKADFYKLKIQSGDAQKLDFADDTFDTVVATLVFCTIPNPELAIQEVYRVMKPGGRFILLEHVRKHTPIAGAILDLITPLWKEVAGGCHLNRDPGPMLERVGFKTHSCNELWNGFGKTWELSK